MKQLIFLFTLCIIVPKLDLQAQSTDRWAIGLELQQYPTGTLPGIHIGRSLGNGQHWLDLRLGYNIVYHGDAGVHEDETGGGFGVSPAYQYWWKPGREGLFLGFRVDFWDNTIDWKDNIGQTNEIRGTTEILVVQPTALLGYGLTIGEQWRFVPTFGLGAEINTQQEGEDVGQGMIALLGFQFSYQW